MVFFEGSEREDNFLEQKNICSFSRGLVHGFCQKIEIFKL